MEQAKIKDALILQLDERISILENEMQKLGSIEDLLKHLESIDNEILESKEVLSLDDACKLLNLSKSRIYKLARKSDIPHYKPQRKLMFLRSELIDWIKKSRDTPHLNTDEMGIIER